MDEAAWSQAMRPSVEAAIAVSRDNTIPGNFIRRRVAALCAAATIGLLSSTAIAQTYPVKPVRFIAPYAVGGGVDIVSRLIAARLSESLGQQVVVDNRPGAGAIIGSEVLAKSAPDGHTIMMANIAHGANPALHSKLPYDTMKDFASVTLVALLPSILVVHPSLPVKSTRDLLAFARSRPGQLNYGSAGLGSANHLTMEMFKSATGLAAVHIAYKGGGPALTDLLGGQIPMMFITIPPAIPHVRAGKLRALAVSSAKRAAILPDVPTVAETGVPGFEVYEWQGVVAPAGTPKEVVAKLNVEINRVLALPDVREKIAGLGADIVGSTPEQLTDHIKAEIARWTKVLKSSGRLD